MINSYIHNQYSYVDDVTYAARCDDAAFELYVKSKRCYIYIAEGSFNLRKLISRNSQSLQSNSVFIDKIASIMVMQWFYSCSHDIRKQSGNANKSNPWLGITVLKINMPEILSEFLNISLNMLIYSQI